MLKVPWPEPIPLSRPFRSQSPGIKNSLDDLISIDLGMTLGFRDMTPPDSEPDTPPVPNPDRRRIIVGLETKKPNWLLWMVAALILILAIILLLANL